MTPPPHIYVATDIRPGLTLRAWRHERRAAVASSRRRAARLLPMTRCPQR
jgi:hypothetical protein